MLRPGFDPNAEAIVEKDPGLHAAATAGLGGTAPAEPPAGTAEYTGEGAQAAKVLVETASPALVLVRNAYERNWHATVDGRPAPVLPADSLIQAVPVGPGRHVVRLAYDDPTIGYGLLGSALSLVALAAAAALFAAKERRTPAAG